MEGIALQRGIAKEVQKSWKMRKLVFLVGKSYPEIS